MSRHVRLKGAAGQYSMAMLAIIWRLTYELLILMKQPYWIKLKMIKKWKFINDGVKRPNVENSLYPNKIYGPLDNHITIEKKNLNVNLTKSSLLDACTEIVTNNGRPLTIFNDSGFTKILRPLTEAIYFYAASSTVNVGSPPRKRQLTDDKSYSKMTSPSRLPVVARPASCVRKPPDTARTTTPSKTNGRFEGPSPMAVSPAVLVGHWWETARAIEAQEAKRCLDASDINDRPVKRFRQDERKRPLEVGVSGSSSTSSRLLPVIRPVNLDQWFKTARAVVAYEAKRLLDASDNTDRSAKQYRPNDRKLASEVSSGPTCSIIRLSYPVTIAPGQPTTRVDAATPRRSAIPVAVLGQSIVTVTGTATSRQKSFDAPRLVSKVCSGPTRLIIRLSYPVATAPRQPATRVDAATPRRSAVPITVPGKSAVTVTGTATPRQQSVDGPLPLSAMSLLLRRNNTGVLGRDGGYDEDDPPAFLSWGVDGVEPQPPIDDPSSLPLPPSRPHVGVIALGPTSASVAWDVGPPVTRVDGTLAVTAPVLRYEIYVCRDRTAADPASPWLMMAHAEPPPAAATDGSGDLMYRDLTGLPTDEQLYFAVVPVDVYGRQADDFDVAGVILKA